VSGAASIAGADALHRCLRAMAAFDGQQVSLKRRGEVDFRRKRARRAHMRAMSAIDG